MVRLLAKLLISDRENVDDPRVRRQYGELCGAVGVVLNALLYAAKTAAGALTGSIAILADAFNNLTDAGSSVLTLVGFKISGKGDDREHPFGHGRAEYISGLIVAMLIILMGFHAATESLEKIFTPHEVHFSRLSMGILAASIAVKLYMALYNASVGRKIRSVSMRAAALDSLGDAASTAAVMISAAVTHFSGVNIDPYAGLLVSALILKAGWDAARDTISPLLGNPPDPKFVEKILQIVKSYDCVLGVHDLLVHDYGPGRIMISLHVEVPADGSFTELHDRIDAIEHRLSGELNCRAVIHMDPVNTDDAEVARVRHRVEEILSTGLHADVTVHDFRVVSGPTHTNVIFDAVVPLEVRMTEEQLQDEIARLIAEVDDTWYTFVTIDRPYI